jgi:outer membrane protein OmpA-like peptidoglycan-associated protein
MRKIFNKVTILLIAVLFVCNGFAQVSNNGRAMKYYDEHQYTKAINYFEKVVSAGDKVDAEVISRLSNCYRITGDDEKAEAWYAQLMSVRERKAIDVYYYAQVLKSNRKYTEADNWMRLYNDLVPDDTRAIMHLSRPNYVKELNPLVSSYKLSLLSINSPQSEFGTAFFVDKIVFASENDPNPLIQNRTSDTKDAYFDLYFATREPGGSLTNPLYFSNKINTKVHEGPACFTYDGLQMYFTRNSDAGRRTSAGKGHSNLKIYRATLAGDEWVNIDPMPFNSYDYNVAHPSLSRDGSRLYFASDMPGGYGGTDIYVVENRNGIWGRPQNLGKLVNTEGNESFPFIHENNILYFSSDGHVGLGGSDVFSAMMIRGEFKNITNLSAPINSSKDDFSFLLDREMKSGYVTSNRPGGIGEDDIYSFVYEEQSELYVLEGKLKDDRDFIIPNAEVVFKDDNGVVVAKTATDDQGVYSIKLNRFKTYTLSTQLPGYANVHKMIPQFLVGDVKYNDIQLGNSEMTVTGVVVNKENRQAIKDAFVYLTNKKTYEKTNIITAVDGKFGFKLTPEGDYTLRVEKDGFFARTVEFSTRNKRPGYEVNLDQFELEGIILNQTVEIPNIYYDLGKADIRPDAAFELDKLVKLMKENSSLIIELGSHTDARGSSKSNQRLSQKRAEAAVAYIVSKGIAPYRLTAKGFGEEELKNRCADNVNCSEQEHARNRRTEFKVISF